MAAQVIDVIIKLRERAEKDKSCPDEWTFGKKPDYLARAEELKGQFGITEAMIAYYTRVCEQTGMIEQLRKE